MPFVNGIYFENSIYEINPIMCQTSNLSKFEKNLEFSSSWFQISSLRCVCGVYISYLLKNKKKKPSKIAMVTKNMCRNRSRNRENGKNNKAGM